MSAMLYFIKCLTNMHVGNGDVNYNIIDNEVEKDAVTGYPVINSSGVKGALRQYFTENGQESVYHLFGSDVTSSKNNQSVSTPGALKIFSAYMLARPARASAGNKPYYLVTTEEAINQLIRTYSAMTENKMNIEICGLDNVSCQVEGYNADKKINVSGSYLEKFVNDDLYVLSDEKIRKIPLPVVARNKLDNGESKNLWYEELVPHESIFWFMVAGNDEDLKTFDSVVKDKVIQFGGNASVGCGFCLVES